MKHKWHNEIIAWAKGADIEYTYDDISSSSAWLTPLEDPDWDCKLYKFRIKSQPKEPQYLYAYSVDGEIKLFKNIHGALIPCKNPLNVFCIGKIKLESEE